MLVIQGKSRIGYLRGATSALKEEPGSQTLESKSHLVMAWLVNSMDPKIGRRYLFTRQPNKSGTLFELYSDLGDSSQIFEVCWNKASCQWQIITMIHAGFGRSSICSMMLIGTAMKIIKGEKVWLSSWAEQRTWWCLRMCPWSKAFSEHNGGFFWGQKRRESKTSDGWWKEGSD